MTTVQERRLTTQEQQDPTLELEDFPTLTEKYQRELLAHCYRMSGSVHEAEDLVQETFLRAWKASASFQGRSSVRTWLYRIATNVCLTNLEGRPRRPLPAGLGTHAQMAERGLTEDTVEEGLDDGQRVLLDQYVDAFWRKDIEAIVKLLKAEAIWEMPPFTSWYLGNENIGRLIATQCPGGINDMPMIETRANGQPAFGLYMRTADGFEPFHLQVLEIRDGKVARVGAFFDPGLFTTFGLPARLPAGYRPGDPVPDVPVAKGDHVPMGHESVADRR